MNRSKFEIGVSSTTQAEEERILHGALAGIPKCHAAGKDNQVSHKMIDDLVACRSPHARV